MHQNISLDLLADFETGRIKGATFFSVSQRFRSEVVSSFQKPFKPCHRHCRPFRIAVAVTPLSPVSWTRRGKGERSNLCGGPAPPHSPRDRNTAARFGSRAPCSSSHDGKRMNVLPSLNRISDGQPGRHRSLLSSRPLCLLLLVCHRMCRTYWP